MSDILEKGAKWLAKKRNAHMTRTVTYIRGSDAIEINATVGRSEFEESDDYGQLLRHQSRDYLVLTEDLVIGGAQTTPMPGDVIQDEEGKATVNYEVMSPGGQPAWRYTDGQHQTLRIHTKLID